MTEHRSLAAQGMTEHRSLAAQGMAPRRTRNPSCFGVPTHGAKRKLNALREQLARWGGGAAARHAAVER